MGTNYREAFSVRAAVETRKKKTIGANEKNILIYWILWEGRGTELERASVIKQTYVDGR